MSRIRSFLPGWSRQVILACRPLFSLVILGGIVFVMLMLLHPNLDLMPIIEPKREESLPHVIEAGKAYGDLVGMLTTLAIGIFVIVGLVVNQRILPQERISIADAVLLMLIAVSVIGSFYMAMQARFVIAEGILFHQLETEEITRLIGLQAWLTLGGGLCAASLVSEAMMTYKKTPEKGE